MGVARFGTEIGLPTKRSRLLAWHRILSKVRGWRTMVPTNDGEWNLVRHQRHALTNEQTRGKAHNLFEQVLQPPTQAPIWENDLLKELILPEWVNRHQVSPVEHHQRSHQCVQAPPAHSWYILYVLNPVLTQTRALSAQILSSASRPQCWPQERRQETQQRPLSQSQLHCPYHFWRGGAPDWIYWLGRDLFGEGR